jgi:hypothetical protein
MAVVHRFAERAWQVFKGRLTILLASFSRFESHFSYCKKMAMLRCRMISHYGE